MKKNIKTMAFIITLSMCWTSFIPVSYVQGKESEKEMYTVKEADTLTKIATKFGNSYQQLALQNKIENPNYIYPGQQLDVSITPTDYSDPNNWFMISAGSKPVDIFYIYPSVYARQTADEPTITSIQSGKMIPGVIRMVEEQASAFASEGNLYVPYYRQADPAFALSLPAAEQSRFTGGVPARDTIAAFDYYIKNYNNGRPFILAGHSQGSQTMLFLLSEYMKENPDVQDRMIAAYAIGYSVTQQYLADNSHLKFAESAVDTGVIISYNTEAPNMTVKNPVVTEGSIAINPLTWTRSEERAGTEANLGAVLLSPEGKVQKVNGFADAAVNLSRGTVTVSTVNPADYLLPSGIFPAGCYHGSDYAFFYDNLRQNAKDRIASFNNK